jgi:hypothetical protein
MVKIPNSEQKSLLAKYGVFNAVIVGSAKTNSALVDGTVIVYNRDFQVVNRIPCQSIKKSQWGSLFQET